MTDWGDEVPLDVCAVCHRPGLHLGQCPRPVYPRNTRIFHSTKRAYAWVLCPHELDVNLIWVIRDITGVKVGWYGVRCWTEEAALVGVFAGIDVGVDVD